VGWVVMVGMVLAGIGVMTGLLDRQRMGFHVLTVLGVTVGLQLLILTGGGLAWLVRGRFSRGLGFVPECLGWLAGKLGKAGGGGRLEWWRNVRADGGRAWAALGWNLLRLSQAGAVMFSAGLMAGLLGCLWFMEVGFFWESTTPEWMAKRIDEVCGFLSAPWSWVLPGWRPDAGTIAGTRWGAVPRAGIFANAAGWYRFLFAAIFFWALLPRLALWGFALWRERRALGGMDFQAKRHGKLWRELMGTRRRDVGAAALDGVLVLDVGGTGLRRDDLRGFLLRRLRVNPGEWFTVGVWDGKGEAAAERSIGNAPAGVVLLAEGWALSPPRMTALHRQIRGLAGAEVMIYFLVVNAGDDGGPMGVKAEEQGIWRDFVDGLRDAAAEVFFYEEEEAA
ncbi:MAG: DUF2868 domain-containing protein, partial [Armatimonadetes bacterium]|nr:DUF2868 domain-containing protein [Akkermansiaceae bacterium]